MSTSPAKDRFDHKFSGYSVWIEPKNELYYKRKIEKLAEKCGGSERGCYVFDPHITLLYNIENPFIRKEREDNESNKMDKKIIAESLLQECVEQYKKQLFINKNSDKNDNDTSCKIMFKPQPYYYFHYPKEADNGKGYGCLVLLLLIDPDFSILPSALPPPSTLTQQTLSLSRQSEDNEKNDVEKLYLLQKVVSSIFPPDERHANSDSTSDDPDGGKGGGKYIPHMSLIYAAESETWLEKTSREWNSIRYDIDSKKDTEMRDTDDEFVYEQKPIHGQYLTLWRTQGQICDWEKIAEVEIC